MGDLMKLIGFGLLVVALSLAGQGSGLAKGRTLMVKTNTIGKGMRTLDPDQLWIIETSKGTIWVELSPEVAPKAVERIKTLTRRGFYDGLWFHRVLEQFVVQTGNPNNKDGGKSDLLNLKPEFMFTLKDKGGFLPVARPQRLSLGFLRTLPVVRHDPMPVPPQTPLKPARAYVTYCPGVVGMGRDEDVGTANSEIFFMTGHWPMLDHNYTPVGRVLKGYEILTHLKSGEVVLDADKMIRVRMASDLSEAERPQVRVEEATSRTFQRRLQILRRQKGADFSICDVSFRIEEGKKGAGG